jgi:conserved repeat domain
VAPVQVFFGVVEAQVLSVSFNQIIVLTPPASGAGLPNLNSQVDVRVHEVNSGLDATLTAGFRFVVPLQITAIDDNQQGAPFRPVTIHGQGFLAPVAVSLAGIPATVISVSATELLVLPGPPPPTTPCPSGPVVVTNIDSGDTQSALTFTYLCPPTPTPTPTLIPTSTPPPTPTPTPTATRTSTPVPPDLELSKTASPPSITLSSSNTLTFQLTVTNKGSVPVNNVVVTDPLQSGMAFQSCLTSQGSCTGPAINTNCTLNPCPVSASLGTIQAPGFALVTINVTVNAPAGTSVTNTGVVSSTPQDPNPAHTISTVTVPVNP